MNHHFLSSLGVGHPSIDKVRSVTAQYSLHSKLTGAGGGGCVLTLLRDGKYIKNISFYYICIKYYFNNINFLIIIDVTSDDIMRIMLDLKSLGFECFETQVGGYGVSVIDDASSTINKQEFLLSENLHFSGWKYFN